MENDLEKVAYTQFASPKPYWISLTTGHLKAENMEENEDLHAGIHAQWQTKAEATTLSDRKGTHQNARQIRC